MKSYVKPELFYESFEMNQSIAACGIDVHHDDEFKCTPTLDNSFWPGLGNETVFDESPRCSMKPSAIAVYCYTVGTNEAGKLFNS